MPPDDKVAQLETRLRRLEARFGSLRDSAIALSSTLDADLLLTIIIRETTRAMGAERSTLFLFDDARRELWSKIAEGATASEIRVKVGEGLAGHVALTGERINIPDAYADPRFCPDWDQRTGFRTVSVLCEPIRNSRGALIGVIQVMNKLEGAFTSDDETLLAALASQASISLENSKLLRAALAKNEELLATQRQLERKMFELEFLFRIEQDLNRALEQSRVIESVIEKATGVFGVQAGAVLLVAEKADELYFGYATGQRGEVVKRFRLPLGQGIAGWVARNGLPILTNDPQGDPRHYWPIAETLSFPARNILCVPLLADDRIVGAFELMNKESGDFTEDDLKLLTLIAGLVSKAIQQVRHREAQERASRLADLGQALSSVLHDFKTPMAAISGYVQLMAADLRPDDRIKYSEAVLRQFDHMGTMMREVLAFARGESTVLHRKVYVHTFIQELEELLAAELQARSMSLEIDLRYRGVARFDDGKMRRAIYNIARNAAEAMSPGGSFHITIDREGNDLCFAFRDTGPGIPEDIQDRLFDSFVSRGKADGTGLGLAIVKKIVAEHHGDVRFETAPGKGTTFFVRIPIEPESSSGHTP